MNPTDFDDSYKEIPPWDIGRPQPEFVRLAEQGAIVGTVLDVGCGTGENAIYLAQRGHDVLGVDFTAKAIERAVAKAKTRDVDVNFQVHDALNLGTLNVEFDTIIDSAVFHVFSDEERPRYVEGLAAAMKAGGTYYMVCFSKREPGDWGPRRVTQAEIRASFSNGWEIEYIRPAVYYTNRDVEEVHAWLVSITRSIQGDESGLSCRPEPE